MFVQKMFNGLSQVDVWIKDVGFDRLTTYWINSTISSEQFLIGISRVGITILITDWIPHDHFCDSAYQSPRYLCFGAVFLL